MDDETGLYYLSSRYYDPKTGSFTSADSYRGEGEQFWQLYAYCVGDPVNYVDITGFSPMPWNLLVRPGEIHDQVVKKIAHSYKLLKEFALTTGRCDLIDLKTGEIWEVKPASVNMAKANEQLNRYIRGRAKYKAYQNYKKPFRKGGKAIGSGKFTYKKYTVNYWNAGHGIIKYSFRLTKKLSKATVPNSVKATTPNTNWGAIIALVVIGGAIIIVTGGSAGSAIVALV